MAYGDVFCGAAVALAFDGAVVSWLGWAGDGPAAVSASWGDVGVVVRRELGVGAVLHEFAAVAAAGFGLSGVEVVSANAFCGAAVALAEGFSDVVVGGVEDCPAAVAVAGEGDAAWSSGGVHGTPP